MKKILITGNLGYIGTFLTDVLIKKYKIVGCDIGYFKKCIIAKNFKKKNFKQINKDINEINLNDLKNVNTIIHLAALSNDPLGEMNKKLTYEVNYKSTIKLAKLAKSSGVKRFIYISTQSLYGISSSKKVLNESAKKNPITAYAKTKLLAENIIKDLIDDNFKILIFRPATVFGPSARFRSDIILNNLVGSAVTTGKINILSDGKPWRPILHITDICKVIEKSINIKITKKINGEAFNVGVKNGNYTVNQLAKIVKNNIKNTKIIYSKNPPKDERTYKVNFNKLYKVFGKNIIIPNKINLQIKQLATFLKKNNFMLKDFTSAKTNRILQLKKIFNAI